MTKFLSKHNLAPESFLVTREQKEALNRQKAFVIWLTGLSGSGKSTIARILEVRLFKAGIRTLILDGDNTRMSINRDLDFSPEGRTENIRRVAEIARLLNDAGVVVITAFIAPFRKDRETAKEIIGKDCFVEIFVDAPLEICMKRDTKGLYMKALNGELKDFTGVSSPYEEPLNPQLRVSTDNQSPEESVFQIINFISSGNLI
ncbi:MAG: adenylyl-sulfate kinase [Mariniphaga sp.]